MQKISLFIFDLDGTLIDSKRDIAASLHYTLNLLGLPQIDDETIYSFVGNGVTPLIHRSVEAAGGIDFESALKIFLEHYLEHCLDTTRAFPGVVEVLNSYRDIPKVILTNKSQRFADKILEGLSLRSYFPDVLGGDTAFPKKPDPTAVHHLMKRHQVGPEETVIVGDSLVDIQTGKNAGIHTCGALYGFRPVAELEASGADCLISGIGEMKVYY